MAQKKIGIIVQRYGTDINGGAEYHARLIAEKMSRHFEVEVFTSTAHDYITWEHHYPEGTELIDNIPVHRFPVTKPRDPKKFGDLQEIIFEEEHPIDSEIMWLDEQGPYVPQLLEELENMPAWSAELTIPDLAPTWGMSIQMKLSGSKGEKVDREIHNSIFELK